MMTETRIQRILIVKPSSMGDIIHGLLIASAIKAQLPHVSIDWVVRVEFAGLVQAATVIDHSYLFNRSAGVGGFVRLIREVRTQPYDAVLDLQGLARSAIITFAAHALRKIGRSDARECAGLAYHEVTPAFSTADIPHAVEILAGFLPILGLRQSVPSALVFKLPDVPIALPEPVDGGKRVVVFPESRRAEKNWLGYEALTSWLLAQPGIGQVLWCGHSPVEASAAVLDKRLINLTGQTRIAQLPELLNMANCVVSNDSGPMHLAAALGRPLVALFGPTKPERFGPYPPSNCQRVIRRPDGDITAISVESVGAAVLSVLEQSS